MSNFLKERNNQILCFVMALMVFLMIRLFSLTIVQQDQWSSASENISIKNIHTVAPRGEIKDRYGRILAGNKPNFVVQMMKTDVSDAELNNMITSLVEIFEKNGDVYIDTFPILTENGKFYFTYDKAVSDWLHSQEMPTNYTAQQAFREVRRRQGIDENLDKYEAQSELQTVYNVFPPISVKNMKFLQELEKQAFLTKYHIEEDLSAKEAFEALRKEFKIKNNVSHEMARKIMIIRNSLVSQGYRMYTSVKIATNVSESTIVAIKESGNTKFKGVEVVAEPVRVYPYGDLASHIIGYLGQISESEKEKYVKELGYNSNDLIGKEGLEKAYESTLKGKDGVKSVEVNAFGKLVRTMNETQPSKGKDIYLTLDLELQKVAQASLEKALYEIRRGGVYTSEWGNYNYSKTYPNANAGAVVALDVKTGDVLAMASYPGFDPNLFANGISDEAWNSLQSANPRDSLSPLPLYNIATKTAVQPGSTYKPMVGVAAVENGINPNAKLYDGGAIKMGISKTFGCSIWNSRRGSHGALSLMEALEVSCNYYFYDMSTGYDFYKKAKLPGDMSIEKAIDLSEKLGLGVPTGIEIPETVVGVPSQAKKHERTTALLRSNLNRKAKDFFAESVYSNEATLKQNIDTIVSWTDENPTRNAIMERLEDLGVKKGKISEVADLCKYTYFSQAKWDQSDRLNLSIGQGEHSYTPVQMARYIATIANDGYNYETSVIKGIEGEPKKEKEKVDRIDLTNNDSLKYVRQGMYQVVSGSRGTARGTLGKLPIKVAAKTGTAEKAGKVNPPDEVEYIRTYLGRINARLTFAQVEEEMFRLMKEEPETYSSKNTAVRRAVINLSGGKISEKHIDAYKKNYDNFAWSVSFAPYDDPQIAIAVLLFQGGAGNYGSPVAMDIIAQYMELKATYEDFSIDEKMTQ